MTVERQIAEQELNTRCTCERRDLRSSGSTLWCGRCCAAVSIPQTCAFVSGRAVPFGERCWIAGPNGQSGFETFAPYAFTESIRAGGITLRINHSEVSH